MSAKGESKKLVFMAILVSSMFVLKPAAALAADRPSDDTITIWVMEALRQDPRVVGADVQVSTSKGIVRLSGTVWNLADREYANLEAKKINGVRGVIDELTVEPTYRRDTDLRQDVRRRLMNSSTIRSQGLAVTVLDGEATLTGTVASWTELKQAGLLAKEVVGVKAVHNGLTIETAFQRPDDQIRKDVAATIRRDVYLTALPIDVTVKDGVVLLKGKVGNAYQKERASEDAWVDGATSVKNKVTVEWWGEQGVRRQQTTPTNDQVKQAVRDELYQDLRILSPYEINVDASYGEITLRGTVPTYHQKRLAERDIRNVVGVWWVNDLLSVNTERRSDLAILNDLRFELDTDYALCGQDIHPYVKNGTVRLSGNVNNSFERDQAVEIAADVLGVREVINGITVNRPPIFGDTALAHRVGDRLAANWETYVVADQITVNVKDGKAVLTGQVDNWAEYREAAQVAILTDGIWAVDNQLTIKDVEYPWLG